MSVLDELLTQVRSLHLDDQVRELCRKITEEESSKIVHKELLPAGPNIFLVLECPERLRGEVTFLALEREAMGKYLISVWTKKEVSKRSVQRVSVNDVIDTSTAKKILLHFAETYKLMMGK